MRVIAPDLTAYSVKQANEPQGTIGIPVRDHMNAATVTSIITSALGPSWFPKEHSIDFNIIVGSILTAQRNELVQRMRGDWLLFIDDDMVWQPDTIRRLVETRDKWDLDMVGALCYRRSPPFQPTLYVREQPTSGSYNFLESWAPDTCVEVDATGMAFIVIHQRVFERMVAHFEGTPGWTMPPFAERQGGRPPNFFRWNGPFGEDLQFCQDAKASGSRIFVDTSIPVGHRGEIEIGQREFLLELAMRDEATLVERRKLNATMDLPTVERDEAWGLLAGLTTTPSSSTSPPSTARPGSTLERQAGPEPTPI